MKNIGSAKKIEPLLMMMSRKKKIEDGLPSPNSSMATTKKDRSSTKDGPLSQYLKPTGPPLSPKKKTKKKTPLCVDGIHFSSVSDCIFLFKQFFSVATE